MRTVTLADLLIAVVLFGVLIVGELWSISNQLTKILDTLRNMNADIDKANDALSAIESACEVTAYGKNTAEDDMT